MNKEVRVGTRGSKLALTQTRMVIAELSRANPDVAFTEVIVKTLGDKVTDVPLFKVGGQGLFIKEIEEALADGRVDLAVHSLKDVPHKLAAGLALGAISERKDPRDVLITRGGTSYRELPAHSRIGTSSLRRRSQLRQMRDDMIFTDLRGNLDTRLKKLEDGEADAIVLAAAGLTRLGLADRIVAPFPVEELIPAAGQGLLGLECREKDLPWLAPLLAPIESRAGRAAADAERAFLAKLQGGCQVPLAVHARFVGEEQMEVLGFLGDPDTRDVVRATVTGPVASAAALGATIVDDLLKNGGRAIMARWENLRQHTLAAPANRKDQAS